MNDLENQVRVVAEARKKADEVSHNLRSSQSIWEVANHTLFEENELAKIQCGESEQLLRELTLQAYALDPTNKAPAPGVSVKIFQVLSYEQAEAMKWASEHRVALKLDVSTFEKISKVDKPSFVTITEEPRAQIAKSLG